MLSRARLDLQVDAGLVRFSEDEDNFPLAVDERIEGSDATLPFYGTRIGLSVPLFEGTRLLGLGFYARSIQRSTVTYRRQVCLLFVCGGEDASVQYGGASLGVYLSYAAARPLPRAAAAAAPPAPPGDDRLDEAPGSQPAAPATEPVTSAPGDP